MRPGRVLWVVCLLAWVPWAVLAALTFRGWEDDPQGDVVYAVVFVGVIAVAVRAGRGASPPVGIVAGVLAAAVQTIALYFVPPICEGVSSYCGV